jgi:aminoglycoside phosphotransferase (APT) family kinase protein
MDRGTHTRLLATINAQHQTAFTLKTALAGGYQDGALLLRDSAGTPFVLKQWYRPQAIPILTLLASRGYPAKAPLIAGHTDDKMPYWIQAYLPGTPMAYLHAQYCDQIIAINTLQAALPPHLHDPAQSWSTYAHRVIFQNESAWFAMLQAYAPDVATFVEQLQAWAQTWKDTPLIHTDAVHGDFTPDNIVVQANHITGVIDTAAMGCGTRAIDLATLLHYAYLYGYSDEVKQHLHTSMAAHFDQGTIAIASAYRILAMLAWAAEHDPRTTVQHYIEQSRRLLHDLR